jgi:hypothetical protein
MTIPIYFNVKTRGSKKKWLSKRHFCFFIEVNIERFFRLIFKFIFGVKITPKLTHLLNVWAKYPRLSTFFGLFSKLGLGSRGSKINSRS